MKKWKKIRRMDNIFPLEEGMKKFNHLLSKYKKLYESKSMSDEYALKLVADVRDFLATLQNRNAYWEERRAHFLRLAIGMIAFGVAMITAIGAVFDRLIIHSWTFVLMGFVLAASIAVLCGGIYVIHIWNRQNNPDYPFTKGYRHWRWQYRYAEETIPEFKYRYESKEEFEKDIETYLKNLHSYAQRTLNLKPMEILEQDISQLFLLIENEKYKIKFVSELRDSFTKSLFVTLWVGIGALVICSILVRTGVYNTIATDFLKDVAGSIQITPTK